MIGTAFNDTPGRRRYVACLLLVVVFTICATTMPIIIWQSGWPEARDVWRHMWVSFLEMWNGA